MPNQTSPSAATAATRDAKSKALSDLLADPTLITDTNPKTTQKIKQHLEALTPELAERAVRVMYQRLVKAPNGNAMAQLNADSRNFNFAAQYFYTHALGELNKLPVAAGDAPAVPAGEAAHQRLLAFVKDHPPEKTSPAITLTNMAIEKLNSRGGILLVQAADDAQFDKVGFKSPTQDSTSPVSAAPAPPAAIPSTRPSPPDVPKQASPQPSAAPELRVSEPRAVEAFSFERKQLTLKQRFMKWGFSFTPETPPVEKKPNPVLAMLKARSAQARASGINLFRSIIAGAAKRFNERPRVSREDLARVTKKIVATAQAGWTATRANAPIAMMRTRAAMQVIRQHAKPYIDRVARWLNEPVSSPASQATVSGTKPVAPYVREPDVDAGEEMRRRVDDFLQTGRAVWTKTQPARAVAYKKAALGLNKLLTESQEAWVKTQPARARAYKISAAGLARLRTESQIAFMFAGIRLTKRLDSLRAATDAARKPVTREWARVKTEVAEYAKIERAARAKMFKRIFSRSNDL